VGGSSMTPDHDQTNIPVGAAAPSARAATLYHVFADGPGGGSPCPVVAHAGGLSSEAMTTITRSWGLETVFISEESTPDSGIRLRYFVPEHEMEMCVHATVAALTYARDHGVLTPGPQRVQTALGLIDAEIVLDGRIVVEQFPPVFGDPLPDVAAQLSAAMGCSSDQIIVTSDVPRAVSVSRSKLLVQLDRVAALRELAPHAERITALCWELDVTGLYPFAISDAAVHARQFPANSGYVEDPATGLAAAALAAHLTCRETDDGEYTYDVHQGLDMGHPSRIRAHTTRRRGEITRVAVSGYAQQA